MSEDARVFSYVDTALAFAYFNVAWDPPDRERQELERLRLLPTRERRARAQGYWSIYSELLTSRFGHIYRHEWHHCLQAIFYPFLYIQSSRELRYAHRLLSSLRRSTEPIRVKFGAPTFDLDEETRNTITQTSMVVGMELDTRKRLQMVPREAEDYRPRDLTMIDLVECATSIFEFRTERQSDGTGEEFRVWTNEHRAYTGPINLIGKMLGVQAAYLAMPALVQAAFRTTWPVTAFVNLANHLVTEGAGRVEELGTVGVYRSLTRILDCERLCPIGRPHLDGNAHTDEFLALDESSYNALVEESRTHSIYPLARMHLDRLRADPSWEFALLAPHAPGVFAALRRDFPPAMLTIRVHTPSTSARESLIKINDALIGVPVAADPEISYDAYLPELQKRKDLAYSLFTDLNQQLEHNCVHETCEYHPVGLCRRWSALPPAPASCPFPSWLEAVTHRTLVPQTGTFNRKKAT
jgi:hypothetical protein